MVKCLEHHRITFSFLIIRALLVFFLLLESNDLRSALPRFRSKSNDLQYALPRFRSESNDLR